MLVLNPDRVGGISQTGRQRIPDRRSGETERALTKTFRERKGEGHNMIMWAKYNIFFYPNYNAKSDSLLRHVPFCVKTGYTQNDDE